MIQLELDANAVTRRQLLGNREHGDWQRCRVRVSDESILVNAQHPAVASDGGISAVRSAKTALLDDASVQLFEHVRL